MQLNLTECSTTHLWTSVKSKFSRGRKPRTPNVRLAASNAGEGKGGRAEGGGGRGGLPTVSGGGEVWTPVIDMLRRVYIPNFSATDN